MRLVQSVILLCDHLRYRFNFEPGDHGTSKFDDPWPNE